jgi:formylglycine-generating enzyme required for sulfatase activity
VFSDELQGLNRQGPAMVVMPAGNFMMGSPDNEADRASNEGPRHRVTIDRGFAMGRTEVSVGQFSIFIDDTGYRTDAERAGSSRVYDPRSGRMDRQNRITWRHDYVGDRADDDLPVVHVSWNDAQAYVIWLRERTGRSYRLPSEAEFEYALRAGSQTPYWWGDGSPGSVVENLTGDGDSSPTGARWNVAFRRYSDGFWGPAPVGSFEPNPFGLHDMSGNVMEWTEDCWHDSFVRAPGDGSAWVNPGCNRRVIRGGSWSSTPAMSRSAFRLSSADDSTDMRVGFRIARDL